MANKADYKQDASRAINLNYLAQLHCSKNEFEEAEKLYREALEIAQASTHENDPELIMPLHRLGLVCRIRENFTDAETHYKRAYLLAMHNYKLNDVRIAARANFLAGLYNAMDLYHMSEIMLRHSLVLYEKAFGTESQAVEFALLALALVVRFQGEETRADDLYHQSLRVSQKKKPDEGTKQSRELASLAQKFYKMKEYAEAESVFRYALIIGEENFWPDHPFVIEAYEKVGNWYLTQKSYTGAVDFLEQAVVRAERLYTENPSKLVGLYERFIDALEKANDYRVNEYKSKLNQARAAD